MKKEEIAKWRKEIEKLKKDEEDFPEEYTEQGTLFIIVAFYIFCISIFIGCAFQYFL